MKKYFYGVFVAIATFTAIGGTARADKPSVHGMLLFGGHTTYVSHLPMFHAPHDYQVILKVSLQDQPGMKTVDSYEKLKKLKPNEIFTIAPEVMDLTKVIDQTKSSFQAEVFAGHFERGGVSLGSVTVQIEQIQYAEKLDPFKKNIENSYLVFGENGEYFAAHLIGAKPNFDAIVSVSQSYTLKYPPCRRRLCEEPKMIPVNLKLPAVFQASSFPIEPPTVGDTLRTTELIEAAIQKLIYIESDDLSH